VGAIGSGPYDAGPRPGVDVQSGRAELLADADRPGGWLLLVDRIRQSYVDLEDPGYLDFEYMRTLAGAIDAFRAGPLAVTHIGGGALTLPRYIAATRPGSTQIVLDPDARLTAFVRRRLPLERGSRIRVRAVDGRSGLGALRAGSADVIVLDAFAGGRVPADLTTVEAFAEAARVLRNDGMLLANLADGPPLAYLRCVGAAVGRVFPVALVVGDAGVLRGRRFGNVCLVAGPSAVPEPAIRRAAAGADFPLRVLGGPSLRAFVAGATPLTDANPMRSPAPPDEAWRVGEA
jgi:hypothetical protein